MKRLLVSFATLTVLALPLMAAVIAPPAPAWFSPDAPQQWSRQRGGRGGMRGRSGIMYGVSDEEIKKLNSPYDGRFIFARIKYTPSVRTSSRNTDIKWDHDYPRAERNFARIIEAITYIEPYMEGGNIFNIGEEELYKYPWAYLCEPGFWTMTDEEAENLRTYLFKGGFLVIDDFYRDHWYNFERRIRELLPGYDLVRLDASHPIFHTFFDIDDLGKLGTMNRYGSMPSFYGMYEDNDPGKRLLLIVNYDTDIGDYWEWSDMNYVPIDLSNEAYKLGINYIIYSMTH